MLHLGRSLAILNKLVLIAFSFDSSLPLPFSLPSSRNGTAAGRGRINRDSWLPAGTCSAVGWLHAEGVTPLLTSSGSGFSWGHMERDTRHPAGSCSAVKGSEVRDEQAWRWMQDSERSCVIDSGSSRRLVQLHRCSLDRLLRFPHVLGNTLISDDSRRKVLRLVNSPKLSGKATSAGASTAKVESRDRWPMDSGRVRRLVQSWKRRTVRLGRWPKLSGSPERATSTNSRSCNATFLESYSL